MANLFARATANWASANWNTQADGGGTEATPGANDVCMANSFTVTIPSNVTVSEIRNDTTGGATDGGGFTINNGVTVTANVFAGGQGTACASIAASATVNIIGNVTAGTASNAHGCSMGSGSTLTITGTVTGGTSATARGVSVGGTTLNVTGNVVGGSAGAGVYSNASNTINVTGNTLGSATGTGPGVLNNAGGTATISGYAQGNDYGPGSAGISGIAVGAQNTAQGILEVGAIKMGAKGVGGVSGAYRFASTTAASYTARATSGLTEVILCPIAAVVPAVTDVKSGVVYGDGGYTGTLVSSGGNTNMAGHFS